MNKLFFAVIILSLTTAFAEEAKHEHHHGDGELKISFLDNMVINAEIHAPAEVFVGFEHTPKQASEKKAVQDLFKKLKDPKNLFLLSDKADCKLNLLEPHGKIFEGVEGVDQYPTKPGHVHENHDGDHSDVEISYSIQCFKGKSLKGLKVALFKNLKKLKKLNVETKIVDSQSLEAKATQLKLIEKKYSAVLTPVSNTVPGF